VKKRVQEIKTTLEEMMPDIRAKKVAVYAIDEVHLLEGDLISHLWGDSQDRLYIPMMNEENPIEAVLLSLKNLLRRCYRFCKNFSIIKRLFEMLADYKLFNFPSLKNYDAFSCLI